MKKKLSILVMMVLVLGLIFSMGTNTFAASSSMSASGANSVAQDSTMTITFAVKGATISSGSIELSCSSDLEIVSGKWLLSGTMMADYSNKKGAAAFTKATAVNGNYFQVTVKGKNISKNATVTAKAILKNGSNTVATLTSTKTISVICKTHSFGDWTTKEATCTANGSKTRTCSVCGTTESQTIPALGHSITNATIVKAATCTETGTEKGTCSRCGKEVTQVIPAKGHDWGSWIVTKESTCSEAGVETRTCKTCGATETQAAALAKHDFGGSETVVREATISVPGLVSGTCKNCGQTVEQEIPCAAKDETTGVTFSANEGVFLPGTEIKVSKLESISDAVTTALKSVSAKYQAYSLEALLNGANVQPNGEFEVTFAIPEGYGENVMVVYVDDNGKIEVEGTVNNGDGTVTATLTHFSTYAVCEMGAASTGSASGIMLYVAIGEAVVLVILLILLIVKGKKRA